MRIEFESEQEELKRLLAEAERTEHSLDDDTVRITESRMRGSGRKGEKRGKRMKA